MLFRSNALTYGGVTLSNSVTGTGSMVLSSSPTLTTPNIGTPSAGTLTNCTGLPAAGVTGLGGYATISNSATANSLGANVSLNNIANYFDGPSVAQGSTGTWYVSGTVTVGVPVAGSRLNAKLWDGTTVIASAQTFSTTTGNGITTIALSGTLASPAGNLRISVNSPDSTSGTIYYNLSGNSKDSTITAIRVG
mgnify:FL=1